MNKKKNFYNQEGVRKLQQLVMDAAVCMFLTKREETAAIEGQSTPEEARPMSVAGVDDRGHLWFLANKKSRKVDAIESEQTVRLLFANPGKEVYLDLQGEAQVLTDRDKINELWSPMASSWLPGGDQDPNLCLIEVRLSQALYWDQEHGKMVEFLKVVRSAFTGLPANEVVSGEIRIPN
jgi:general stress protein 26